MDNLITRDTWQTLKSRYSIYMVVIVMIIVCNMLNENFFSTRNIANISAQISVTTILAFGETLLIIAGLLDLSCGSVLALAGVLSVYIYKETGSMTVSFVAGNRVWRAMQLRKRNIGPILPNSSVYRDVGHDDDGQRIFAAFHPGPEHLPDWRLRLVWSRKSRVSCRSQ